MINKPRWFWKTNHRNLSIEIPAGIDWCFAEISYVIWCLATMAALGAIVLPAAYFYVSHYDVWPGLSITVLIILFAGLGKDVVDYMAKLDPKLGDVK